MLRLFAQQGFAVFLRNLVIVGVDFAEGQEAVAIAAIFDERRLQRRFDAGYLGQIDIALELLVLGGLEIKLLDAVSLGDGDPGSFPEPRSAPNKKAAAARGGRLRSIGFKRKKTLLPRAARVRSWTRMRSSVTSTRGANATASAWEEGMASLIRHQPVTG